MQTGPGDRPITFGGRPRHVEGLGHLLDREPAEETHLDDPRLPWMLRRQTVECLVECEQVAHPRLPDPNDVIERDSSPIAAPLQGTSPIGMIDEHLSHDARCDREEVFAILELRRAVAGETHPGLVGQGRGLEGVIAPFPAQMSPGNPPQLVVDLDRETAVRAIVATLPAIEQPREIVAARPRGG